MGLQQPKAGERIDDFILEEKIHQGGMASLWRVRRAPQSGGAGGGDATAQGDGGPWIMKIPFLGAASNASVLMSFEEECMLLPHLKGPHVPRSIASANFSEHPYLVLEEIAGGTLDAWFEKKNLPISEICDRMAKVATAVHALHIQGVIHLDLKPANIMERPSGEVVLIDFGLARHRKWPDLLAECFHTPLGSGPYISPEQTQGIRSSHLSDVFALGVMLYRAVTGHYPFGSPTTNAGLRQRLWQEPTPPRKLRPDCPPALQEIILRCLQVEWPQRCPSALRLAVDLRRLDQVPLSPLAQKKKRSPWWRRWGQRFISHEWVEATSRELEPVATSPLLMLAIDMGAKDEALNAALAEAATFWLSQLPLARLACVAVQNEPLLQIGGHNTDSQGIGASAQRLSALQQWSRQYALNGNITHSLLEHSNPATALVEFAQANGVDHLIMGARTQRPKLSRLGSVSAHVVANAPCTVTVVRAKRPE